jgi:hypothetical protein
MRHYVGILFLRGLIAAPSNVLAHGALAVAEQNNGYLASALSYNDATQAEANSEAINVCTNAIVSSSEPCRVIAVYKDTCLGFARSGPHGYVTRYAPTLVAATNAALNACIQSVLQGTFPTNPLAQRVCSQYAYAQCDETPVSYQTSVPLTNAPFNLSNNQNSQFGLSPGGNPLNIIFPLVACGFAIFIVIALLNTFMPQPMAPNMSAVSVAPLPQEEAPPRPHSQVSAAEPGADRVNRTPQRSGDPQPVEPVQSNVPPTSPDTANPQPAPNISDPPEGMFLKLRRDTKQGRFGAIVYTLDARIDASKAIRATIAKHKLGNSFIYESANKQKYRERALRRADELSATPFTHSSTEKAFLSIFKSAYNVGGMAYNAARSALALKITVDSLLAGVHIECKDMAEFGEAEEAIIDAKANLEAIIQRIASFDGREEII